MFDELSLRKSSWQAGNNVNVIRDAVYVHEIGAEVAADCCEKAWMRGRTFASSQVSRFFVLKMM